VPRRHALLASRLDRLDRALPGLAEGAPEAIHDARVATRRLRELLPLLPVAPDEGKDLRRSLRAATRRLGRVRELDVLLEIVARLPATHEFPHDALECVARAARRERKRALSRATAPKFGRRVARLVRSLSRLDRDLAASAGARDEAGWRRAIAARAAGRASDLSRRLVQAGDAYAQEKLHAVRVAVKKLRYARELAAEAAGRKGSRELRLLARVQDELGDLHDLEVLAARTRSARAAHQRSEALDADLAAMAEGLDRRCRALHARWLRHRGALAALAARAHGPG
jgi:CHAD domain-containing protein